MINCTYFDDLMAQIEEDIVKRIQFFILYINFGGR